MILSRFSKLTKFLGPSKSTWQKMDRAYNYLQTRSILETSLISTFYLRVYLKVDINGGILHEFLDRF
jgi:hypothetical protein